MFLELEYIIHSILVDIFQGSIAMALSCDRSYLTCVGENDSIQIHYIIKLKFNSYCTHYFSLENVLYKNVELLM